MVMFGWLCISVFPSSIGSSFLIVMLLVLQMGLREFVHKLATECYQYICFRHRLPPDPDSITPPSAVSEGGSPHASEGALAIYVIFHYLRPKLMLYNPWNLNERECGSGETEVVLKVGCFLILVGLLYPYRIICGLIPYMNESQRSLNAAEEEELTSLQSEHYPPTKS